MIWRRAVTPANGGRKDRWMWRWRWSRALGRRGSTLVFFGVVDIALAVSLLTDPPGPRLPHTGLLLPVEMWAVLWAAVGGISLVSAWMKPPRDAVAFALTAAIRVLWGTAFFFAWVTHDLYRGWVSAIIWWLFAMHVLIVSGWVEPSYETPEADGNEPPDDGRAEAGSGDAT